MFRESDSRKAAREFFNAEVKNLDSATKAVLKTSAQALKREVAKQLRKFKVRPGSTFAKAIKIRDLPPRGSLGAASIVRLGVPFMDAFQEGKTVTGKGNLIILLPPGEQLGFKRITKGNRWVDVWARIKTKSRVVQVSNGQVILYSYQGRNYPIYKFQKQVKDPKKISFFELHEQIGNSVVPEIEKLLNNTNF